MEKYNKTRKRVTGCNINYDMSDKEIIEYLADEIEQYRMRIEEQNKIIDELHNKTIKSDECILDTSNEVVDRDIEEIITTTEYIEGKPICSRMDYKYKKQLEKKLIGIYEAKVFKYNDGRKEIQYICDKEKNEECTKKNCGNAYCRYTADEKYAKNLLD